ncbi:RRN3-domain-containing protein [Tilletiaria anomala UBC 951]|uniref:RRN3-domain-containing protein n=1 Tax=Tilletiaria anomala (strain ATCC 24038 / CBS 436.72 / UBC 951) TaxID=1037660 RepID=A0A066VA55_TILAU|nr:RRN3-domain-containing protein [Tilletiaria anomala UBC 951]KDN38632.1 RRN3-domain-containing protein [Tilletiaria anomala UBC 951]
MSQVAVKASTMPPAATSSSNPRSRMATSSKSATNIKTCNASAAAAAVVASNSTNSMKGVKRSREGILKNSLRRSGSTSSISTIGAAGTDGEEAQTPIATTPAPAMPMSILTNRTSDSDSGISGLPPSSQPSSFPSKRRSGADSAKVMSSAAGASTGNTGGVTSGEFAAASVSWVTGAESLKQGMYMSFVTNALAQKAAGSPTQYYELVSAFQMPTNNAGVAAAAAGRSIASPSTLQSWLTALSSHVSKLDTSHTALVENILLLPWTTMNESFATVWVRFVCALVSARGEWIAPLLERAVKSLSFRSDWRALAFAGFSSDPLEHSSQAATASAPTRRQIYARIHRLIRQLIVLVPTLPSQLGSLLTRHFPPKRDTRTAQLVFIRNALKVCEYCQELSEGVLTMVIGRALQIDVEIQVELDELEDEQGADGFREEQLDPFDRRIDDEDDEDDDNSDAGSISDDEALLAGGDGGDDSDGFSILSDEDVMGNDSEQVRSMVHIRSLVQHLDSIMKTAFDHLNGLHIHYQQQAQHYSISTASNHSIGSSHYTSAFGKRTPSPPEPILESAPLRGTTQGGTSADRALYRDMRSESAAVQARQSLFASLLSIFARSVLPTFKSRHVQFLLFWFSSLDPEYADFFLGALLSKALYGSVDMNTSAVNGGSGGAGDEPPIIRVAAASYIASLVSRAKFIDGDICRDVVENLCAFLEGHLEAYATPGTSIAAAPPGTDPHTVFYSVAQATFYIFCFRWRDLTASAAKRDMSNGGATCLSTSQGGGECNGSAFGVSPAFSFSSDSKSAAGDSDVSVPVGPGVPIPGLAGGSWVDALSVLVRAITSCLNPLRYCSPAIVHQFAHVAQHAGFFYCFSIIEANKRSAKNEDVVNTFMRDGAERVGTPTADRPNTQRETRHDSPKHQQGRQQVADSQVSLVDSFFPFDPYRLLLSAPYVDSLYREWSEVAPDDESEDDEEDSSEDNEQTMDDDDAEEDEEHSTYRICASGSGALAVPNGRPRSPKKSKGKGKTKTKITSKMSTSFSSAATGSESEAQSSVAQSFEAMSISPFKH